MTHNYIYCNGCNYEKRTTKDPLPFQEKHWKKYGHHTRVIRASDNDIDAYVHKN